METFSMVRTGGFELTVLAPKQTIDNSLREMHLRVRYIQDKKSRT